MRHLWNYDKDKMSARCWVCDTEVSLVGPSMGIPIVGVAECGRETFLNNQKNE